MKKVIPLLAAAMLLMFSHSSFGAVPHEEFLSFRNIKDQAWREDNLMTVRSDQIGQGQIVAQLREACGSEDAVHQIQIIVGDITFSAKLYDNQTARAFAEMLPLSLDMKELNGNEKFCYLFGSLPTNSTRPSSIHAGDLMLFSSDCLVCVLRKLFQLLQLYTTWIFRRYGRTSRGAWKRRCKGDFSS